ncbi:uncharacterized protein BBA_05951 [Beauveria bassiana ARSEF 2860]|uniref:Uncharacterized protein n=1 Tax=Beauveria bassiana (strain ARSEF 2860) TaxID=655819 RepID=J5JQT4_BEAB2|nr:uncharacterized protein BBA_05951 [Beauveria bassiana ARSEF 2860]EJP65181.1 hypothetical protein BBA_05951 [Beauveria bassiana ARSEF 2860]
MSPNLTLALRQTFADILQPGAPPHRGASSDEMPSSLPPTTRDYIGRTAGFPEVSFGDDHDSLAIGLDRVQVLLGVNVIREDTEERGRARGHFFVRDRCCML